MRTMLAQEEPEWRSVLCGKRNSRNTSILCWCGRYRHRRICSTTISCPVSIRRWCRHIRPRQVQHRASSMYSEMVPAMRGDLYLLEWTRESRQTNASIISQASELEAKPLPASDSSSLVITRDSSSGSNGDKGWSDSGWHDSPAFRRAFCCPSPVLEGRSEEPEWKRVKSKSVVHRKFPHSIPSSGVKSS